jgi:prefoldin alpha subunit
MSNDDEKINNLLIEIRLLESTFNQLTARQGILERALIETQAAINTITGLEPANTEEILIPIGGGALIKSRPPNIEKILINVGSNVVLEKNREQIMEIIEKRIKELEENIISILTQRNQIAQRLEADRQALNILASRQAQRQ